MTIEELLSAGEKMQESLGREHYLTLAGLKQEPEFQQIYESFAQLAAEETLALVREIGSQPLLEWVVHNRIDRDLAIFDERRIRWEQQTRLVIGGRELEYLRVPIELANSGDREYRMALEVARARIRRTGLNPILRERMNAEHAAMGSFGYEDYVEGIAALSGIDLDELAEESAEFLDATEDMYLDSLARLVSRRMAIPIADLVRADAAWLFRADEYDGAFPARGLVQLARRQMSELGLDALQGGRVRLDTEDRAGKQARAFCAPVQVPQEVYLVIRPHGGHNDYRTFWHELGHAMHFAAPPVQAPFEARWLGDSSVTEGFAMLWDHLTLNRGWLSRYTDLNAEQVRTLEFELAVQELQLLRRYASKIRYELLLHRGGATDMGRAYATLLTRATSFAYREEDYLADVDAAFYSARYLRAWQGEARLAETLRARCGEDWYRNPEAGEFVHQLMSRGQAAPADQLILEVTGLPLSFEPVRRRLESVLV